MQKFIIISILILITACNIPSLKSVKIFKAESESQSIYYLYDAPVLDENGNPVLDENGNPTTEEKEIRIKASHSDFNDYWAVNSEDLGKIIRKLKQCENKK